MTLYKAGTGEWNRLPPSVTSIRPLGTAEWFTFPPGTKPTFEIGDLWLSRLPTGEPVGFRDDRHVLLCSGTRAGKGTSFLIPNLAIWPGSAVVIDPKGENAAVTARRRGRGSKYTYGMGQEVHLLDPFHEARGKGDNLWDMRARFNPIDLLTGNNPEAVEEAGKIATAIIAEQSKDAFWDNAAQGVLAKLCLHVATSNDFKSNERNLLTVRRLLIEGDKELHKLLALNTDASTLPSALVLLFESMARNFAFGGVIARTGEQLLNMELGSPKMLFSILQVAVTNTDFIDGPAMAECLGSSSFSIKSLKTDTKGVSLYLCLPQRYMPTHFRWLRMMATLILNEMERTRQQPACGHPVLMILDEFAGLKRMPVIENAAAQIAGFGVKLVFVVQTLAQLKDVYKDNWETLLANAGTKLFFGNEDHFTREYVSKLIGECEVTRETWSESITKGASLANALGSSIGLTESIANNRNSSTSMNGRDFSFGHGSGTTMTAGVSLTSNTTVTQTSNESKTVGRTQSIHKRWLVSPDEVGRIFGDREHLRALVLISGKQPLLLHRTHYFKDRAFEARVGPHADHPLPISCAEHEKRQMDRSLKRKYQEIQEAAKAKENRRLRLEIERVEIERKARACRLARERAKIEEDASSPWDFIQGACLGLIFAFLMIWFDKWIR